MSGPRKTGGGGRHGGNAEVAARTTDGPDRTGDDWLDGGTALQVMKATSAGVDMEDTNLWGAEALGEDGWSEKGFVRPPMPMDGLWITYINSNVLRQCARAYFATVDAFGAVVEPILNPEAEDFEKKLAELVFEERVYLYEQGKSKDEPRWPEGDDLETQKAEYLNRLRMELAGCRVWIKTVVDKGRSLVYLRSRIRDEWVGLGNAAIEVMRDLGGRPSRFGWVSMLRLAPTKLDEQPVEVEEKLRVGLKILTRKVWRRFRRWAQVLESGKEIWFKEYGDPRIMSRRTGEYFEDEAAWKKHLVNAAEFSMDGDEHKPDIEATEIYHFSVPDSRSVWGSPMWYGAIRSVLGSTAAEDVNLVFFDGSAIPPYAVLVNGGKLKSGADQVIAEHFKKLRGRKNRHKVLILEAMPPKSKGGVNAGATGKVEIVFERLYQQDEATFLKYDEANRDKASETMRVPRILRGATGDFNRATASAALTMFENMVAGPTRAEWDDEFDGFLRDREYRLVRMRSRSPITRDPETQAKIVDLLSKAGGLTPGEVRDQAADILNAELPEIDEPWTKQPMLMTLAGIQPSGAGAPGAGDVTGPELTAGTDPARLNEAVNRLVALRSAIDEARKGGVHLRGGVGEEQTLRMEISWDEMQRIVEPEPEAGPGDEA